jgi:hypothetical protein
MTDFAFIRDVILVVLSEVVVAYSAAWVHLTLGGVAALTFTMIAIVAWLDVIPRVVSESEDF